MLPKSNTMHDHKCIGSRGMIFARRMAVQRWNSYEKWREVKHMLWKKEAYKCRHVQKKLMPIGVMSPNYRIQMLSLNRSYCPIFSHDTMYGFVMGLMMVLVCRVLGFEEQG
jgi:hypothetical protein